jgi:hypothetical protein
MDVLNKIVLNSSLNGMPKWYKALSLLLFSTIVIFLLTMLVMLFVYAGSISVRFGY